MSKTRKDITVTGRMADEVRTAVQKWFSGNGVKVQENTPTYIKGRWGSGFLTAGKYFKVTFKETEGDTIAQTEGWIAAFGLSDQEFSPTAIIGAIPKREGWATMERLWNMLKELSKKASRFCPACGQGIMVQNAKICPKCGNSLTI